MAERDNRVVRDPPEGLTPVVERNIDALFRHRREEEKQRTRQEKIADGVTRFTGSLLFVYIHLALFGMWIFINLGWIPLVPRFDESFVVLAMFASVEAIFISTFVLISQNRMAALADKRADLDVQVSLLTEHELTRLISLVDAIAEKLDVGDARGEELNELKQDVAPERVLEEMDRSARRLGLGGS
ncbi:MAG: DUF1003 domain-containing protein [Gemmatimonadetes bacterium]|nr:DUF1003 domain-containing protein [Gemmatimonadota bacterium]